MIFCLFFISLLFLLINLLIRETEQDEEETANAITPENARFLTQSSEKRDPNIRGKRL